MKTKKEIPFVAFGNEELAMNDDVGETAICPNCGKSHKVQFGRNAKTGEISKMLGFVHCGKADYLVAVEGKKIK